MLRYLPFLVEFALLVFCLIDCIQTDSFRVRNLPRPLWVLLIVLLPLIGPIAWLVAGRPPRDTATSRVPWPSTGTAEVALPQDVCDQVYAEDGYEASVSNLAQVSLNSDTVFGDDGGAGQLATVSGDVASGYAVSLAVGIDTTTTPTGGGVSGGGAPGGPPPGNP